MCELCVSAPTHWWIDFEVHLARKSNWSVKQYSIEILLSRLSPLRRLHTIACFPFTTFTDELVLLCLFSSQHSMGADCPMSHSERDGETYRTTMNCWTLVLKSETIARRRLDSLSVFVGAAWTQTQHHHHCWATAEQYRQCRALIEIYDAKWSKWEWKWVKTGKDWNRNGWKSKQMNECKYIKTETQTHCAIPPWCKFCYSS